MKKQFKLMALASATMLFAACSQENLLSPQEQLAQSPENNAIQFGTYMGKAGTRTEVSKDYTKGMIGNADADFTTSLQKARFGVFAYYTGDKDYGPASTSAWRTAATEKNPNFMYNQEMKFDNSDASGVNAWIYTPVKYWPNGTDAANTTPSNTAKENDVAKLSFYAFAPYTAGTAAYDGSVPTEVSTADAGVIVANIQKTGLTNGVAAITANNSQSNVWVKYLMPNAQVDEAVDLLWGVRGSFQYRETDNDNNPSTAFTSLDGNSYNINLTKQIVKESSTTEKVKFLFKHALTKIGGQTVSAENNDETPASPTDQIGFKVVADVDVNTATTTGDHDDQATYFGSGFNPAQTLVTLKEVKIQDGAKAAADVNVKSVTTATSNLFNSGWFNIETGEWKGGAIETEGATVEIVAKSDDENQTYVNDVKYSINKVIREVSAYTKSDGAGPKKLAAGGATWDGASGPTGVTTTAQPVFAKENIPGILLIPGSTAQTLYITVDYFVRTADPNLAKGYSEVEQVITNQVDLSALSSNKYYTIIMHLGLTSVKFEAKVADWANTKGGTYDESGHYTPGTGTDADEEEQVVWLPSNVVK